MANSIDRENVIKAYEDFINGYECFCTSDDYEYEMHKAVLALLKEQQQRIEVLEIDIDILVKDINTNNCNTCKRECEHRPRLGETVRANCFMWEGT